MKAQTALAAVRCLTLALSGVEAGEDASRLDLEMYLICFDYRPAVVTRLIRQTPAALFTG